MLFALLTASCNDTKCNNKNTNESETSYEMDEGKAVEGLCVLKAPRGARNIIAIYLIGGPYICRFFIRELGGVEYTSVDIYIYPFEIEDYLKNPQKVREEYEKIREERKTVSADKEKVKPDVRLEKPKVEDESNEEEKGSGFGMSFGGKVGIKPFEDAPIVITPDGPEIGFGF